MYFVHLLLVFLLVVYESQQNQILNRWKFNVPEQQHNTVGRLLELMRSYYEEANSRLFQLNKLRFMYEESPYYEMGFITGEIIERYRKVLEMAQRPVRFLFLAVPDTIKIVELTQKLYFELYHLVRMIHETPRKWHYEAEFSNIEKQAGIEQLGKVKTPEELEMESMSEIGLKDLLSMQRNLHDLQRRREKEKKRQKKKLDKLRQAYMSGLVNNMRLKGKNYNKFWPLDYGWEIDYEW